MTKKRPKDTPPKSEPTKPPTRYVKLAHTLHPTTLDRIEYFAYKARVSKSAIIDLALAQLFERGEDRVIAALREGGVGRRRAQ